MGLLSQLGSFGNINDFARKLQSYGGNTLSSTNSQPQASYTTYTPQDDYDAQYDDIYGGLVNELDTTIDELLGIAQGDYDYAAKWIENEYKLALGNDDQERQNFLKSVANELETKVGTIAYDYRTGKYRTEQDKELALNRLAEDERTLKRNLEVEGEIGREEQGAGLNQRGLMSGTRETTTGLGKKFIDRFEQTVKDKLAAIDLASNRDRQDINIGTGRRLEDLKTTARRGAIGTQFDRDKGLEAYKRALDKRKAELERDRTLGRTRELPLLAQGLVEKGLV